MPVTRFYSSTAGKMVLQLGVTAVATALSVDTTVGLPGSTPFTLLLDAGTSAEEIVTVTQVSGNTLVVQRGQDGTSAQAHPNGAIIRHALTARDLRESREHEAAAVAHGVASNLVGVNDAQALTNKNLSAATNTFPSSLASTNVVTAHTAATAAHGATGAVVGTDNVQTLTNKTLASPQFTGTVTSPSGDLNVGDATLSTQRVVRVYKKAASGPDTFEGLFYLSNDTTTASTTLLLKKNGVEVGRAALADDGTFKVNSGFVAVSGDVTIGASADTSQRTYRVQRHATTGTKSFEFASYLGDPGDGTLAIVQRLAQDGVEKGRTTMFADGSFAFSGKVTAPNLNTDTGWVTAGFAASSGWTVVGCVYRTVNGVTTCHVRANRTGATITPTAQGGISDTNVVLLPVPIQSSYLLAGAGQLSTAGAGTVGFTWKVNPGGQFVLTGATNGATAITSGSDLFATVTYIV